MDYKNRDLKTDLVKSIKIPSKYKGQNVSVQKTYDVMVKQYKKATIQINTCVDNWNQNLTIEYYPECTSFYDKDDLRMQCEDLIIFRSRR